VTYFVGHIQKAGHTLYLGPDLADAGT